MLNPEQLAASDPHVSAFVSASAGSGKTKLLTDRLLRLMLAGTAPEKILCLTYTKAAAAEMVLRLNKRLGEWVVMPETALAAALAALDVLPTPAALSLARKLFANVLELPGGMRIGTIHAFCQSLLRRFPLEAGLSPHFEVADDATAAARLREVRETVLAAPTHQEAIYALAAETDERSFAGILNSLTAGETDVLRRFSPHDLAAMVRAALGAGDGSSEALLSAAVVWPREGHVKAVLQKIAGSGNPSGQKWANEALGWLERHPLHRAEAWEDWLKAHFTTGGTARTLKGFCGKQLAGEEEPIKAEISRECARIEAIQEELRAVRLAELNAGLVMLAAPILQGERAQKQLAAQLSYGDLVSYTGELLVDPGAAWILYKLDGGIDHLLLDEVQDTAPAQWEIAGAIADEFFAGEGARGQARSVFAVGDAKQSIFSFQGADLESFTKYRRIFRTKVADAGRMWLDGQLSVSYRSTAPVLGLVDAVFAEGPAREGVCEPGEVLRHGVSRVGQAGAITLWPLTAEEEPAPTEPWAVPDAYIHAVSAKVRLAREIAAHIKGRLDANEVLASRGRAVTPGDFLILLRTRKGLLGPITAALKALKVPVAGADQMVLTEQQAVSDLLALCDALLLPEDDLAFAQFLVSPFGGLTDESLMALALGRRGWLVAALYARAAERADWAEAMGFFETLRGQVDYAAPFALLSEALGPLGGRARLLRRLGAEAAEPVEEFLAEALAFAQSEPGALQLFVHQLRQSGAAIKREAEAGGDVVRIMTVHGAKGLQAPIVILPDTTGMPDVRQNLFFLPVPQQKEVSVPVFCPRSSLRSSAIAAAAEVEQAADLQEYNRLLYVALTRAEDELLVCGAEGKTELAENCWYALVKAGFARLGVERIAATAQSAGPDRVSTRETEQTAALPPWAGSAPDWRAAPPARETTRPERIAPSRGAEDDAKQAIAASPLGEGLGRLRAARAAAMAKGRAVHALLQHLPELPASERGAAALRYLAGVPELAGQEAKVWAQVREVLTHPGLEALFGEGSRAEIPLAGVVGDVEIGGLVDRLAVTDKQVLMADYKTDRAPPASVEQVPEGYLRQVAAYRAILGEIYPEKDVCCHLMFTENAKVMHVPERLLMQYHPKKEVAFL